MANKNGGDSHHSRHNNNGSSSSSLSVPSSSSQPQPPLSSASSASSSSSNNNRKTIPNGGKMKKTKTKTKKKTLSIHSFVLTIILILIGIECIAYTYINLPESNENNHEVQQVRLQQRLQQQKSIIGLTPSKEQRQRQKQKQIQIQKHSNHQAFLKQQEQEQSATKKQKEYQKKQHKLLQSLPSRYDNTTLDERKKTALIISNMGISINDYTLNEIPPWSQIITNFNSISNDNEPIILGINNEFCQKFRIKYNQRDIATGPAGMFSSGTNLIAVLMKTNCIGPLRRNHGFNLLQVPWGKHNPADARTYRHKVQTPNPKNYDAVLPIVAIRHPYTWMTAMCKHSYATRWKHSRERCMETLDLINPVLRVPYGFKNYPNSTNVTNSYNSLADMWVDWYKAYYLDTVYNNTPRIMVRHEDLIYRPEKVITPICECVGGTIRKDGFHYEEESANKGKGHGKHRSGLLTAIIKYGQPLEDWYSSYTSIDRKIMKSILQGNNENNNDNENEKLMRNIYKTFQYTLYDDISNPIRPKGWKKKMNPILFPPPEQPQQQNQ